MLATSTIVRPTSIAAVTAMLSTRRPQPLRKVYVVAGIAFSLGVGFLVVVVLQGFGGLVGAGTSAHRRGAGRRRALLAAAAGIGWVPRPLGGGPTPSTRPPRGR
jgi:hypothetical protein